LAEGVAQSCGELLAVNWLSHVVRGSGLEGSSPNRAAIVDAGYNHGKSRRGLSKALGKLDPVELGHMHVENGNIESRATCLCERGLWIGKGHGLAAEKLDEHPHNEQASPLVVHNKNPHEDVPR
jgi:hypothetical protein